MELKHHFNILIFVKIFLTIGSLLVIILGIIFINNYLYASSHLTSLSDPKINNDNYVNTLPKDKNIHTLIFYDDQCRHCQKKLPIIYAFNHLNLQSENIKYIDVAKLNSATTNEIETRLHMNLYSKKFPSKYNLQTKTFRSL